MTKTLRSAQFKGTAAHYAHQMWGQHKHGYIFGHNSPKQNSRWAYLYHGAVARWNASHPDSVLYPRWSGFRTHAFAACIPYDATSLYPNAYCSSRIYYANGTGTIPPGTPHNALNHALNTAVKGTLVCGGAALSTATAAGTITAITGVGSIAITGTAAATAGLACEIFTVGTWVVHLWSDKMLTVNELSRTLKEAGYDA
ncbi:MAG: hypothetical protein ACR2JU_01190 [Nocardioidaceae bacterium]